MSALHRAWLADEAARPTPPWVPRGLAATPVAAPVGPGTDTVRRHPRTLDEAFRTPAWRTPVQGPYRRAHPLRQALGWVALALLALAAGGLLA